MDINCFLQELGYEIILPDITIDQMSLEEGCSHDNHSKHEFEVVMSEDGFLKKCLFCRVERKYECNKQQYS